MKTALLVVAVALVVAAGLWNAGEMHRQNCLRAGRVACSVLPWADGNAKPARTGWDTP